MILNRLFKPKWQHPNPRSRIEAVQELDPLDPVLTQVARQDRNTEVRCAALERITELPLLLQIARQDTDTPVRDCALARYRALLAGADGGPALDIRIAAVPTLEREVVEFLATHAQEPELRTAALNRLADESRWADAAVNDASATLRFTALERVQSPALLEQIARQSRNRDKGIHRRAQERVDVFTAEQDRRARLECLVADMESLQWDGDTGVNAGRFPKLEKEWQEVEAGADPEQRARYDQARARFAEQKQQSAARRAARIGICSTLESLIEALASAADVDEELEATVQQTLQKTAAAWEECGLVDDAEARRQEQRYLEARRTLQDREHHLHRDHERSQRLRTALQAGDALLKQTAAVTDTDLKNLQQRWQGLERPESKTQAQRLQSEFETLLDKLRARLVRQAEQKDREWQEMQDLLTELEQVLEAGELQRAVSLHDRVRERLQHNIGLSRKQIETLEHRLHACEPRLNELRGWRRWGTQQAREQLCEQAERLADSALEPVELAKQVKDLRNSWKALDSPEGATSRALWKRFDKACETAYAPCQAYFEAQTRERQHNLTRRQELCERLETINRETDWQQVDWRWVDRTLREAQKEWFKLGPVNRADQKTLNRRYDAAVRKLEERLQPQRERDLHRRRELIQRVQALAESDNLQAAVTGAKQAQSEWQPTVQADRREEQALWRQFRAACDAVFTRRQAAQDAVEAERRENLAQRTVLCEELEALAGADAEGLRQAQRRLNEIRDAWEELGPVPKTAIKALEQRFVQACKQVERREQELRSARLRAEADSLRTRARLCARLEELLWRDAAEGPAAAADAQQEWQALPALKPAPAAAIQRRFDAVCAALAEGGATREALLRELEGHLDRKQTLCLHLEVLAGVESPPEWAQARMEYQVARLSESLAGREPARTPENNRQAARRSEEEWFTLGVLPPEQDALLEARFGRAVAALS
jgi:hypothetical protein